MSDAAESDGFFSESESGEALIAAQTAQTKTKGMASSPAADLEAPKGKTTKKRPHSPTPEHIADAILCSAPKRKSQDGGQKGCGAAVAASTSHRSDADHAFQTPNAQISPDRDPVNDPPSLLASQIRDQDHQILTLTGYGAVGTVISSLFTLAPDTPHLRSTCLMTSPCTRSHDRIQRNAVLDTWTRTNRIGHRLRPTLTSVPRARYHY
ncbi:UNVERIFIED_CONTAM: hypothetical protein K2H54_057987 [Gekko kuhli]